MQVQFYFKRSFEEESSVTSKILPEVDAIIRETYHTNSSSNY